MFKYKPTTASEKLNAAYDHMQPAEWYKVAIVAPDGSTIMDVDVLWRGAQASVFKEVSEGATFTVCRKVETCEPI